MIPHVNTPMVYPWGAHTLDVAGCIGGFRSLGITEGLVVRLWLAPGGPARPRSTTIPNQGKESPHWTQELTT